MKHYISVIGAAALAAGSARYTAGRNAKATSCCPIGDPGRLAYLHQLPFLQNNKYIYEYIQRTNMYLINA